jgi:hypothetical protein
MLASSPSKAARTALVYITVGTLLMIWTCVWYVYLQNNTPTTNTPYYFCGGLFLSGLALIGIGLGVGRIGSEARRAEIPPEAVITAPVLKDTDGKPQGTPPPAGTAPGGVTVVPATRPAGANESRPPERPRH